MKLLAIETSSQACSAALYLDGNILHRSAQEPRQHSQLLLPMVQEVLREGDCILSGLDAMAFGHGPGSFTGVRIATGIIQGLSLGSGIPVIGISTLAAIALRCARTQGPAPVLVAVDARMDEVYWAGYSCQEGREAQVLIPEQLSRPEQVHVAHAATGWQAAGSGWARYAETLRAGHPGLTGVWPEIEPDAVEVALLAAAALVRDTAVPAERAMPRYLRHQVATKPGIKSPER